MWIVPTCRVDALLLGRQGGPVVVRELDGLAAPTEHRAAVARVCNGQVAAPDQGGEGGAARGMALR